MKIYKNKSGGQVIMVTVVAFLIISLAVITSVALPTSNQVKSVLDLKHSKQGYIAADSVNEEALYRLNTPSLSISGSSLTLPFSSGIPDATAVITGTSQKTIITTGKDGQAIRYGKSVLSVGTGIAFSLGVQTGDGGIDMKNTSKITGNVYTNGNITGDSGIASKKVITGSAIAANSVDPNPNTENNSSPVADNPTDGINFRNTSGTVDFAQSFKVSAAADMKVYQISLFIKRSTLNAIPNPTVKIVNNSGTTPSGSVVTTGTLLDSQVTTDYGWVDVVFPNIQTLTAGTTYWIVVDNITYDATNYYTIGANADSSYANGTSKIGTCCGASSWNSISPSSLDSFFRVYLMGAVSQIYKVTVGTDASKDMTWAHTIDNNVNVTGKKYCFVGTNCDADSIAKGDPPPTSFPISDGNIYAWRNEALIGGTTGDVILHENDHIGPKKIVGNLTIDPGNNKKAYMDGTLWVTGNLTISNHAIFQLNPSSYNTNSGVIVVNGTVQIDNGADLIGTGVLNNNKVTSYVMVVATSTGIAVHLDNSSGGVIINAQKGTVSLDNGAGLNQVTAKKLLLDNGADVTYQDGLADQNFTSGPSGSWDVDSWAEVPSP